MLSYKFAALCLAYIACTGSALPIRREVPQEHSHESIITVVRVSLNLDNPDQIQDPVFALLGDAAAAAGAGNINDLSCLQQAVADQAFTNAKAANDVAGMTNALIFRALERNTGQVGLKSALCTQTAKNPEIAALTQHQDPASDGAAAANKAVTLELAKQIASIGGDPLDALKSGTFAPGDLNDATAKGNTCDDADDPNGCIFTQNLLVPDATEDEINAAVAGVANNAASGSNRAGSSNNAGSSANTGSTTDASDCAAATVTVTASDAAQTTAASSVATSAAPATTTNAAGANNAAAAGSAAASGGNLQTFSGALGGVKAPTVTAGGRGFVVENNDDFLNLAAALGRSCDVQHNQCANAANSGGAFSVTDCDQQNTSCRANIQ
ncbi:unnamed protein product [Somion occarium]|uniref:Uncharacterized protein n=1 Tax=Somion occarium TaxID=3059160 RepID=A0ABP1DYN7_9APHY